MRRQRQQSGFSLLEAMLASVLLAAATAGVLLPIVAAAGAQTDAQRRVAAARFAADVIEQMAAMEPAAIARPDHYTRSAADLAYTESAYEGFSVAITTDTADVNGIALILLTVEVFDNNRPMATLKTLLGTQ